MFTAFLSPTQQLATESEVGSENKPTRWKRDAVSSRVFFSRVFRTGEVGEVKPAGRALLDYAYSSGVTVSTEIRLVGHTSCKKSVPAMRLLRHGSSLGKSSSNRSSVSLAEISTYWRCIIPLLDVMSVLLIKILWADPGCP